MKEIYKVQTPKRIVFGDPLYFEEFSGARLEQLVVDVQPPEAFGARVVLREFSAAEAPDTLIRTMEVYLAPEEDMDIYLRGMKYELQECIEKEIGVDTARYYLQVDDREDILHTGGDGYWGSYEELSRNTRDGRMVEAAILTVIWPEYESMESIWSINIWTCTRRTRTSWYIRPDAKNTPRSSLRPSSSPAWTPLPSGRTPIFMMRPRGC